jgi:hypothetical protein
VSPSRKAVADRLDPNALRPRELAQLVNSVQPGTIGARAVESHLMRASHTIGRGRRIHLLLYAAWLTRLLVDGHPLAATATGAARSDMAAYMKARRSAAREIGPIPAVVDPVRRESCRLDLARFMKIYLAESVPLPFADAHLEVLGKLQSAILKGGLFAVSAPRGSGKTTLVEGAVLWAALYGHRRFVEVLSAEKKASERLLAGLRLEIEQNELLAADFPAATFPIRELGGVYARCSGQACCGRRTEIVLRANTIILPSVWLPQGQELSPRPPEADGRVQAASSGTILMGIGLMAAIRGLRYKKAGGEVLRPDLIVLDDPQTDDSARSLEQTEARERLIDGTVMGLAAHTEALAAVMPCTVIRRGDLSDRFLSHELHPAWGGVRIPMVSVWPSDPGQFWTRYSEIRREDIPDGLGGRIEAERRATEFYQYHRVEMDAGAKVFWNECFQRENELSAIQHAWNLLIDLGREVFQAEYQNDPLDPFEGLVLPLQTADLLHRQLGQARAVCPPATTLVTCFIDVGSQTHLHWLACGWSAGFTGSVLDYGRVEVERHGGGLESSVARAVSSTLDALCSRHWQISEGGELMSGLVLIDSGWQTRTIYSVLRRQASPIAFPSKGQGGELDLRWPKGLGRRDRGDGWYHALTRERDARLLVYNVDRWKSFANERLRQEPSVRGAIGFWGTQAQAAGHVELCEHLTSERPSPKDRRTGDVFDKWSVLPGRQNHWLDCLVGCCVAAARMGVELDGQAASTDRPARLGAASDKPISLAALQKERPR